MDDYSVGYRDGYNGTHLNMSSLNGANYQRGLHHGDADAASEMPFDDTDELAGMQSDDVLDDK